jgi:hypothetical protein
MGGRPKGRPHTMRRELFVGAALVAARKPLRPSGAHKGRPYTAGRVT